MASNFSATNLPRLVRAASDPGEARSTVLLPGIDSSAPFMGSFVSLAQYGVKPYAAGEFIFGVVVGMRPPAGGNKPNTGNYPLFDYPNKQGTVTDATTFRPVQYTFASTNDDSNGTSAKRELVEVLPLCPGDILEVTLSDDAGTASVARGTTTAFGTSGSSANIGVYLPVEPDATFALTESAASATATALHFRTVRVDDAQPANPYRVYVECVRAFWHDVAAAS